MRVGLRVGQLRGLSAHLQQAGLRHGMLQRREGVVVPPRVLTQLRGVGEVVHLGGKSGDSTPDGRHTPPAFHRRPTGLQGERQHRRAWRAAAPYMTANVRRSNFCRPGVHSEAGRRAEPLPLGKRCRVSDLGRGGRRQHIPPLGSGQLGLSSRVRRATQTQRVRPRRPGCRAVARPRGHSHLAVGHARAAHEGARADNEGFVEGQVGPHRSDLDKHARAANVRREQHHLESELVPTLHEKHRRLEGPAGSPAEEALLAAWVVLVAQRLRGVADLVQRQPQ
eukprot:scaffold76179_cov35-Phaeocystis_antarctica.AAC.1